MSAPKEVVITGIGMLTSLGNGAAENWRALVDGRKPNVDTETYAPFSVHPLVEVDWSEQIPKRGDQRQMEAWQRIGTYTAGLALADARLSEEEALKASMDMTIAAGGGERDVEVDEAILGEAAGGRNDTGVLVNEKLTTELRPTLFLAQLSNLLAGNISIVHKVTGSSRTFMGEESAGLAAIENATARIRSGQSTHALVGASYNAEHRDMLLSLELAHQLARNGWAHVFDNDGMILGSGGAFLVLEERSHAEARSATIYATIDHVEADLGAEERTTDRLTALAETVDLASADVVLSTATGAQARTQTEHAFLKAQNKPFSDVTSHFGCVREAQALIGTAIAALSLHHSQCPVIDQSDDFERIGVVTVGADSAEGMILLAKGNG